MITVEQINAMKPSWENPVEVIGHISLVKCLIVTPFVHNRACLLDTSDNDIFMLSDTSLEFYSFPPKPKKTLYNFIYKNPSGQWCTGHTLVTKDGTTQDGRPLDYKHFKVLEHTAVEVDDEG